MGKVVMYSTVSVDGFVADENDQPGPLFDWLSSGDVPLDDSGVVKVSQTSYDYTRPYWDQIGVTVVGRHVFDMTDGWDGKPPGGIDHVVVVTHRPEPESWDPGAPFHFVDGVEAAMVKAQELAAERRVDGVIVVDLRVGSPGYGRWAAVPLNDETRRAVFVAEGLGHAFIALSDEATVLYLCSTPYAPGREHGVHPLDPDIGIAWPEDVEVILSDKDAAAPSLAEARSAGLLPDYADCLAYAARLCST